MTAAEHIDALRAILNRTPRISLRTALRAIAEREAVRVTTERLRAEIAAGRQAVRMMAMAGTTEWM